MVKVACCTSAIPNPIQAYPAANAGILRHHGIHVWGENWKKTKLMAEAYHYLLDVAVEMHKLGINEYNKCLMDQRIF